MTTVFAKIQMRRGTAAGWAAANPILAEGELAFEADTGITKIGDGATSYLSLPAYATYDQMLAAQQAIEAAQLQVEEFETSKLAAEAAATTAVTKAAEAASDASTAASAAEVAELKASEASQSEINAASSAAQAAASEGAAADSADASALSAAAAAGSAIVASDKSLEASQFRDEASDAAATASAAADRVDLGDLDEAVASTGADAVAAAASATASAASAAQSEVSRVYADASASAARSARDAAFVNANVFADIATGRAAVSDGLQFQVVTGDEIVRYRRDSSSTQTEVARYPSAAGVAAIVAREVGFIAPPSVSSALYRVHCLEIYRSVNGAAISLPSLLCVRECGRDLTLGGRFRFRLASYDGTSTYTPVANEVGNGTYLARAQSGLTWVGIQADGTSLGVADNTTIGRVLIDFGSDDAFGSYASTIAYAVGGITPSLQQTGTRFENDATEITNDALALSKDYRLPFSDDMINTALRAICRDINVYVNDADRDYSLQVIVAELSAGVTYRLSIDVFDVASGEAMCGFSSGPVSATSVTNFLSSYPTEIGLNDRLVATRRRYIGVAVFDWSSVTAAGTYGGTTAALGGINRANVFGYEDTLALRRNPPLLQTIARVGTGETYTDFTDAVDSFYAFRTGSALQAGIPMSDILHPRKPGQVRAVEDATYTVSNLYLPHDLNLFGMGAGRTILENFTGGSVPVVQAHASGVIERMTLKQWNSSYYVTHVDLVNNNVGNGVVTPLVNTYRDVELIVANAASTQIAFGSGVSSGNEIILENVRAWRENSTATSATYFFHNTGPTISTPGISPSTEMGVVRMDEVASYDYLACDFQTLEPAALCEAILNNCQFNLIQVSVASGLEHLTDLARDRVQWRVSGNYDGPWTMLDPVGQTVLKTTAGQTPSGDAAALIFGAVDDLGRGEKWIAGNPADATSYSLGERLGDCSGASKTLTIGGETHTFTTDLRAVANATIISQINASITSHPVSVVDIQLEWVPDAAPKRRVNNSTGSTIPKGRFVKFTGASTIALCGASERPDGWTHRDILNGAMGQICIGRQVAVQYLTNAASATGEWGITSAGTLDYTAATKLGRTMAGVVEVWA